MTTLNKKQIRAIAKEILYRQLSKMSYSEKYLDDSLQSHLGYRPIIKETQKDLIQDVWDEEIEKILKRLDPTD